MSSPNPLVVFVCSQDPVVQQILLEFLTDLGNTAVGFNSLAELPAKLDSGSPKADVVITSLTAHDSDDIELLQRVHQQFPEVAVILITNGGSSLSASEAASCGVRCFLREPIRLSELELYLTRF